MNNLVYLLGMVLVLHCDGIQAGKFTSRNTKCRGDTVCGKHGYSYWWCYVDDFDHWEYCCSNTCDFHKESYKWCDSGSTWDYCSEISYNADNGQMCDPDHPCGEHYYPKDIHYRYLCYTDIKSKAYASCCPPSYPNCNEEDDYDDD
ncbi:hypothetical protein ACJMK2_008830 [Sinanodonta woodiana]|uniref:Uncharacterized protein n=1 Tax=Sinanodonta woodiana TaxID=1069815 RepID=A0ABD3VP36_SINWO